MKPVLFLDIDGVLNSGRRAEAYKDGETDDLLFFEDPRGFLHWVEKDKLEMFQRFVERVDAVIVGVSSWFEATNDLTTEQDMVTNFAIAEFLGIGDRFIGTTRTTGGGLYRGHAVLNYVVKNNVRAWAVVDDAGENMYDYPTWVINGREGITPKDIESIENSINWQKRWC
ncbi:hypothetical protein AAS21_gp053 [Pantoea phage vB_PagS_AAS21]|uniref:Uncharacterized protein n=1 Tax=Pantoea phage vB_PagS_AAS21 TaxID=2575261 RepID=A0A4Y5P1E5_9CAUD|nr:hypothetical protein AAS21_gp053 [Pantoea phage vB_PagS_AAS21]